MTKISAEAMKELDLRAQTEYGIPGLILMENAGLRAADIALRLLEKKKNKKVSIFCGPGNNGGDGFVLARHLIDKKIKVEVFILAKRKGIKGDALINFNILQHEQQNLKFVLSESKKYIRQKLKQAGLIVDAIFGIGLNKDISGIYREVIELINQSRRSVLALDIPSGLDATSGRVLGVCVRADTTVTFGLAKKGFFLKKGPEHVGHLVIVDISLPRQLLRS